MASASVSQQPFAEVMNRAPRDRVGHPQRRRESVDQRGRIVGVLVQTNYGGVLTINGAPVGQELDRYYLKDQLTSSRITRSRFGPSNPN